MNFGAVAYDTQTAPANFSFQLTDAPPYASMTSGGVFTWSLPTPSGSGAVDPAWYTAYRFVVKSTDDGAVSGSPRNKYTPAFVSANLDVDLDGTLTKWSTAGWDVQKETPIAVDDAFTTPVETQLQDDVLGQVSSTLQTGDRSSGTATFELIGGGPQHAASFTFNSDGTFSYTPAEDYEGLDSFTYRIDDRYQWFEHNQTTGQYTYSQHNYSNVAVVWIEVGLPVRVAMDVHDDEIAEYGGYILPVNSDDDNGNGVRDLAELHGPAADDDLVAVDLLSLLRSDCYQPDFKASLVLDDTSVLRLWYHSNRTNEIIPHAPSEGQSGIEWLLSQMPAKIWVEAISAGTTTLGFQLSATSAAGTDITFPGVNGPGDVVTVVFHGVEIDVDVDSDNDGYVTEADDPLLDARFEEKPWGKHVPTSNPANPDGVELEEVQLAFQCRTCRRPIWTT